MKKSYKLNIVASVIVFVCIILSAILGIYVVKNTHGLLLCFITNIIVVIYFISMCVFFTSCYDSINEWLRKRFLK
jgi:hypothetical protein